MIHNVFPTPICSYELAPNKQNKQAYLDYLYDLKTKDKGFNRSNVNSWHSSPNINLLKEKEFEPLKDFVYQSVKRAINEMGYDKVKLGVTESWAIISPKGAYNKKHHHAGAWLSGSYYVSSPSAPIIFYDPRPIKSFTEPKGMSKATAYNVVSVNIQPKEGLLLLFPSWLDHAVAENETDQDRVIISFNCNLV